MLNNQDYHFHLFMSLNHIFILILLTFFNYYSHYLFIFIINIMITIIMFRFLLYNLYLINFLQLFIKKFMQFIISSKILHSDSFVN